MFKTWADVRAEHAVEPGGIGLMAATEQSASVPPPAAPVDRRAGEGPPACCQRQYVAADMLVWYGGISEDALSRLMARIPRLSNVAREDLFLCDGCRAVLKRERVLLPDEMPRSRPLPS